MTWISGVAVPQEIMKLGKHYRSDGRDTNKIGLVRPILDYPNNKVFDVREYWNYCEEQISSTYEGGEGVHLLVFETIYLCSDMKFLLDLDIGRLLCHRNGEWDDVNYPFSGHWS